MNAGEAIAATVQHNVPAQMLAFGVLLLTAHLLGRLFGRLHLSESTGQLLGGILAGPWTLHALGVLDRVHTAYDQAIEAFGFYVFVFIAVIAFSIGEELHIDRLRRVGRSAVVICLAQVFLTFLLITASFFLIGRRPLLESLLVGSIGVATAPAMTFVLLNKLRIEGRLRHVLGGVEVLCDIMCVVAFSFLVQISQGVAAESELAGHGSLKALLSPILWDLFAAMLIGVGVYAVLRILVRKHNRKPAALSEAGAADSPDGLLHRLLAEHPSPSAEIFIIVLSSVAIGSGLAYALHLPFLMTATAAGFMVANFHSHAIFESMKIENLTAMFNLGFFAIVGSTVRFDALDKNSWLLILLYVAARATGKYVGTWAGCKLVKEDPKITSCLPFLVFPQAGVAAVEAVYASVILGNPGIAAVILPAIVIFEIGGVLMSDRALSRWRSWLSGEEAALREGAQRESAVSTAHVLSEALRPEMVLLDEGSRTTDKLIERLVEHARLNTDQSIEATEAVQLIRERERLAPTGMGHGIAVPHCRLMGLHHPVVVVCRSRHGVVFGGVDDEPCFLIVLILSTTADPSEHLKLLAATARVLGREGIRQRILTATTPAAVVAEMRAAAGEGEA